MKRFYKVMIWLLKFELAITPPSAKCYNQIREDILHWESELHRAEVRGMR